MAKNLPLQSLVFERFDRFRYTSVARSPSRSWSTTVRRFGFSTRRRAGRGRISTAWVAQTGGIRGRDPRGLAVCLTHPTTSVVSRRNRPKDYIRKYTIQSRFCQAPAPKTRRNSLPVHGFRVQFFRTVGSASALSVPILNDPWFVYGSMSVSRFVGSASGGEGGAAFGALIAPTAVSPGLRRNARKAEFQRQCGHKR